MRIAYLSPLPPAASGIADYSAELLPHLSRHAEITLFVAPGSPPDDPRLDAFPVEDITSFEAQHQAFDVVLYHMGNEANYHQHIYETLQRVPGIVVAHETVFYHFFHVLTVNQGDLKGFRQLLEATYGRARAEQALTQLDDWDHTPYAFPLLAPVLSNARGVIVHSQYARRQVQRCRPDLPVAVIPHHLSLPPAAEADFDRAAIRRDLGLEARFVVASFGYLTENKRPAVVLRAFKRFHHHHPEAVCCFVGGVSPMVDVASLIAETGLPPESVHLTGRTPLVQFVRYMIASDVAVNLRYPTSGETSGGVIRLLGLGVPTIVSDVGAFSEFPDDICARVPVDAWEEDTLVAILDALATDEPLRRTMGADARRYVRTHHAVASSAEAYAKFIRQVVSGEARPGGSVEDRPATQVFSDVAATLAGWGVTERHDALLQPIAQALADLAIAPQKVLNEGEA